MSVCRSFVLASASPSRLRLLRSVGIEPTVQPSSVDEDAITATFTKSDQPLDIAALASELARAKAQAVLAEESLPSGCLVLGADSILEWQGAALGKPGTTEAATARLREMRGTYGVLHTGHHVIDSGTGKSVTATASTTVYFSEMNDSEIDAYVRTGEPLHVAGSFTLDGLSSAFIDGVNGDPSNVIGLSLPLLRTMLRDIGVQWLEVVDYA